MPVETHQRDSGGVLVVEIVRLRPVAVPLVSELVVAAGWPALLGETGRSTRRGGMT